MFNRMMAVFRASVNRSWSTGRSGFPAVAGPAFPDEPPHDDDHVRERHPEVDHPPALLSTPHKLLVRVVPRVRAFHDPALRGLQRGGLAPLSDHAAQAAGLQLFAGDLRVVAAVQVYASPIRQLAERLVPPFPRSTGLLPAFSPPQGALVMHPSTVRSDNSRPMRRS